MCVQIFLKNKLTKNKKDHFLIVSVVCTVENSTNAVEYLPLSFGGNIEAMEDASGAILQAI